MKILEIDAGNSRLKWRIVEWQEARRSLVADGIILMPGRAESSLSGEPEELKQKLQEFQIEKVLVSNVRGESFAAEFSEYCFEKFACKPVFAGIENNLNGLQSAYTDPGSMGIDRWLAMLAVYSRKKAAACIIDCGSAMTVDLIAPDGRHEGGFIVPGLTMLQTSLQRETAALPYRHTESYELQPGVNTTQAIQHGAINMLLAMLERVHAQWADGREWYLCGGDAALLSSFITREHKLEPDLVLDGLEVACIPGQDAELSI